MQEAPLHSDSLDLLLGPAGEDASGEEVRESADRSPIAMRQSKNTLLPHYPGDRRTLLQGLTASALQEYLHKVDIRREEVRTLSPAVETAACTLRHASLGTHRFTKHSASGVPSPPPAFPGIAHPLCHRSRALCCGNGGERGGGRGRRRWCCHLYHR